MDTNVLREAGLTNGETKVYLALLKIGSSTTGPIVEKSGIAKSIVYQILEKLIQKGLVSYIVKEKTKYFQASSPVKILDYVHERKIAIDETKKKIEELIPQLLLLQETSPKSEANIYFGLKGVRSVCEKAYLKLKKGDTIYYLGVPVYQPDEQHLYWQKDHVRRIQFGIKINILFNRDTNPKILKNRNSYKGSDARYMPANIKTPALFVIYKDVVIILLQYPEVLAVEIVNQSIADSFRSYFDDFWKRSKSFKYKN